MSKKNIIRIRLLLVEDNNILREGIKNMLKPFRDIKIITSAGNSQKTILKIHNIKPNVILLDLGLRSLKSLKLVELVKKEFPQSKIIIMDLVPVQSDIIQFVRAGASGFILKDATVSDFILTIRAVAGGEKVLPLHLADSLFSKIVENAIKGGKLKIKKAVKMTKREKDIIRLISKAKTNKEISQTLKLSSYVVNSHIHNILEKIALHTRIETENIAANYISLSARKGI